MIGFCFMETDFILYSEIVYLGLKSDTIRNYCAGLFLETLKEFIYEIEIVFADVSFWTDSDKRRCGQ